MAGFMNLSTTPMSSLTSRISPAWFGVAAIAGSIGIYVLRELGASPWVSWGWPPLVMLIYAATSLATRSYVRGIEAIGDNCYYLGFLFTLVSLALTLILAVDADGTLTGSIGGIVVGFGVALVSTITGVLFRAIINQAADFDDAENSIAIISESAREAAEAARITGEKVAENLEGLDAAIQRIVADRIGEASELALQETSKRSETIMEQVQKNVSEMIEEARKRDAQAIETALISAAQRIAKTQNAAVKKAADESAMRLSVASDTLAATMEASRAAIDQMLAEATSRTSDVIYSLENGLGSAAGEHSEAAKRILEIFDALGAAADAVRIGLTARAESMVADTARLSESVTHAQEQVISAMTAAEVAIESQGRAFDERLRAAAEAIKDAGQRIDVSSTEASRALTTEVRALREAVEALRAILDSGAGSFVAAREQIEAILDETEGARASLNSAVTEADRLAQRLSKADRT